MKNALAVAAVVFSVTLTAQQRAPMIESITQSDLRADLFFLAGDAMRGRLTDTNENRITVDYIRSRFERAGLKPAEGNSYFHNYNLMSATLGEGNRLEIAMDGVTRELKSGQEFYPQRFSGPAHVSAPVAFAGFGITAPKWSYDDYHGDVKGKAVLVLDHEPGERDPKSPFEGVVTAEPAAAWRKALAAQQKGAVGILFVSDIHNHPDPANFEQAAGNFWPATPARIPSYTLATWADRIRIPAVQISPALASMLMASNGPGFDELTKRAETPGGITPVPIGRTVTLRTAVNRHVVP